jgi:hypothetical protein
MLTDAELRDDVERKYRLVQSAHADYLAAVRDLDSRPSAVPGARPGKAAQTFLQHRLRAARPAADVRTAQALGDHFPILAKTLSMGDVSRDHVDLAIRTLRRIPRHLLDEPGAMAKVDRWFTDAAASLTPFETEKAAKRLVLYLDPDGQKTIDPNATERRELTITSDWSGMVLVRAQLDPVNGAAFKAAIEHHSAPHPTDPQTGIGDERSKAQRQADAAGHIGRVMLAEAGARRPEPDRPKVVIHLPANESEQLGPLSPAWIARFACDSEVEAVDPEKLFLGKTVRTATPTQRRFLIARDGGCVIPGCFTPGAWCDAHHVRWWSHDGPTDVTNMAMVCPRHHTDVHSGIWAIEMVDGLPWARPPRWIDSDQRLIRHAYPQHRDATDQLALDLNPPHQPIPDDG